MLVLLTNATTVYLSFGALALAACYPFMKRYTFYPQVVLGAAFSWGMPMAFTAETGSLPPEAWLLFIANLLWTVAYDTYYAMADREDDLKIGIKSTAILFGEADRIIIVTLQGLALFCLILAGVRFELGQWFHRAGGRSRLLRLGILEDRLAQATSLLQGVPAQSLGGPGDSRRHRAGLRDEGLSKTPLSKAIFLAPACRLPVTWLQYFRYLMPSDKNGPEA